MQSVDFHAKIRAAWQLLNSEIEIGRSVSSLHSLRVDDEFNKVALDPERSYREIYLAAISRSNYNIILNDYSIFQFSWISTESWRLAYLPNPWIAGVQAAAARIQDWENLESLGGLDEEEVAHLIAELPYYGSIPPIRFEYAVSAYKELSHPAAHMHIGRHTDNRWPLKRVLNPLTFTMIIAKMYYLERWAMLSDFYDGTSGNCVDMRFINELQQSRLVHDFTPNELRSLHFSSQ